jgi:hypothetical protein
MLLKISRILALPNLPAAFIPEPLLSSIVIYCAPFDISKIEFSGEAFKAGIAVGG